MGLELTTWTSRVTHSRQAWCPMGIYPKEMKIIFTQKMYTNAFSNFIYNTKIWKRNPDVLQQVNNKLAHLNHGVLLSHETQHLGIQ